MIKIFCLVCVFYEFLFYFSIGKLMNEQTDIFQTEESVLNSMRRYVIKSKVFLNGFGSFLFYYLRLFWIKQNKKYSSYVFGGFFCEFIIQIECILLTLDTRIYELFNVYFSKKNDEAPFIVVLIAVIVFKTFQISMKNSDVCTCFSQIVCLTLLAGTCDEFITRNSEAILKLKDKKMDLNDEERGKGGL